MYFNLPFAFGLTGAVFGLRIPGFAQNIAQYKRSRKSVKLAVDGRFTSALLKLVICILNTLVWTLAALRMENSIAAFLLSVLFSIAIVIALIDFRIRIIPNELLLVMFITGSALQVVRYGFSALLLPVLCMVAMMVFFTVVAGAVGFGKVGAGDVKLAGVMGLTLGYPSILTALLIMSASLLLCSCIGLALRKLTLHTMVPLAPYMMLGMVLSLTSRIF